MKTYLSVFVSTEGELFSAIGEKLHEFGFKPLKGEYDYVFEWNRAIPNDELFAFIDKVQSSLSGTKATLKFRTE